MNESTEFEERNATIAKEWEHDLKSMKENNEKLFKNYQTLKISLTSGPLVNPTTQDNKNLHVTSRTTQQATEVCTFLCFSICSFIKDLKMHLTSYITFIYNMSYITFQSKIIVLNVLRNMDHLCACVMGLFFKYSSIVAITQLIMKLDII